MPRPPGVRQQPTPVRRQAALAEPEDEAADAGMPPRAAAATEKTWAEATSTSVTQASKLSNQRAPLPTQLRASDLAVLASFHSVS